MTFFGLELRYVNRIFRAVEDPAAAPDIVAEGTEDPGAAAVLVGDDGDVVPGDGSTVRVTPVGAYPEREFEFSMILLALRRAAKNVTLATIIPRSRRMKTNKKNFFMMFRD